jgi:glycosyltransferase involved in cell wall biosynthesis
VAKKCRLLLTVSEFMYSSQVRNLCDLVSGLDKDLFDVEVGALEISNEAASEVAALGVPYYQLRLVPSRHPLPDRVWGFVKSPFVVRKHNYDVVHSLLWQSQAMEPLIFKTFTNTRYVYTKSDLQWDNHSTNWRWKSKLADRIISISGATDDLLKSKGFGDKIVKIYLGIDTERFKHSEEKRSEMRQKYQIPRDATVFGCAAQFMELKDHPTLITAFEGLCGKYHNLFLMFCGPHHGDDYYRKVMKQIEDSPYRSRILYLGTLSDMPAFYSAIDCFVLPSYWEALPYVLSEAMSCSLPVVACRVFGPSDMVADGENGYLCEPSAPADLQQKLESYLTAPELSAKHSVASRQRAVQVFSKEAMVAQCQLLYQALAADKHQ